MTVVWGGGVHVYVTADYRGQSADVIVAVIIAAVPHLSLYQPHSVIQTFHSDCSLLPLCANGIANTSTSLLWYYRFWVI